MTPTLYLAAGAAVASLLLGAAGGWKARDITADRDLSAAHAERDSDRATWSTASASASETQRETERLRRAALDKELTHAHAENDALDRDAAALRAAVARRLRDESAAEDRASSAAGGDSAAAAGSAPAAGPGLVRRELLPGPGEAAELAIAFDAARARGLRCERLYDALSAP